MGGCWDPLTGSGGIRADHWGQLVVVAVAEISVGEILQSRRSRVILQNRVSLIRLNLQNRVGMLTWVNELTLIVFNVGVLSAFRAVFIKTVESTAVGV